MKSLCVLSILFVLSQSAGDFTEPANASVYDDGKLRAMFSVDQATSILTLYMKFRAYGYFSLLYSSKMSNGDYNTVEINGGTVTLSDQYSTGGHNTPSTDTKNDLTLLGSDTDSSTYVTVKYTRPLNTGDTAGKDALLSYGQSLKCSYAWKSGSKILREHGSQFRVFSMVLDNTYSSSSSSSSSSSLDLAHSIILSVLWILVVDAAIFVKYCYGLKWRIILHAILMTLVLLGTIILVGLIISNREPKLSQLNSSFRAHYVIGVIVLAWVITQCLVGVIQGILHYCVVSPYVVSLLRNIHLYFGIVLVLLGKANVILGWAMKAQTVGLVICAVLMALSMLALLFYIWKSSGTISESVFYTQLMPRTNSLSLAYMEYPYCWSLVQNLNIFIFDDFVYAIPPESFHPGGMEVIEEIRGREIDRFMYGSMFTERYPAHPPFDHPKQSMQMVGYPIASLPPNPVCTLQAASFRIRSFVGLAKDLNIFYFEPEGPAGQIVYRTPTSLKHLGQYFVVRAFGYTRLYTCVLCQRHECRSSRERLLSTLVQPNMRLQVYTPEVQLSVAPLSSGEATTNMILSMAANPLKQSLPLIIKRYRKPAKRFTNQLYQQAGAPFLIRGLRGRGMCLQAIPPGNIVVIAGGTGLFPFLDLIDELFKLTIHRTRGVSVYSTAGEQQIAQACLSNKSFHFFISVNELAELVMPDEMNIINASGSTFAKIFVRVSKPMPSGAFGGNTLGKRIGREVIRERVLPLARDLRMVYICGPQKMYMETTSYLNEIGIGNDRIFYV